MKEFKAFILRGNVVDLAVGVVIGAAFSGIITALVTNVITPAISLLNLPDFSKEAIELGKEGPPGDIAYGLVINALISFVMIGAVVFFFVVKPVNHLMARGQEGDAEPQNTECPFCLTSIPIQASVCSACTRDVKPAQTTPARER